MIDSPRIARRYAEMPLDELRMREEQIKLAQVDGGLSRGQQTYRHRVSKAIHTREAEQEAAKVNQMQREAHAQEEMKRLSATRIGTETYGLSSEQLYRRGFDRGRRDALNGLPAVDPRDRLELLGYRDAFRAVRRDRDSTGGYGW